MTREPVDRIRISTILEMVDAKEETREERRRANLDVDWGVSVLLLWFVIAWSDFVWWRVVSFVVGHGFYTKTGLLESCLVSSDRRCKTVGISISE